MKIRNKNIIKTALVAVLVIGGLYSTQKVSAEWTPNEQLLNGVEAHNLNNKKLKNATKADYENLQELSKQSGAHYLDKPVAVYLFPQNNDSKGTPEIYDYQDDGKGQYVKGDKDDDYTNFDIRTLKPHRIIGTINIDGQGYIIEHKLDFVGQYLISTDYINLPYAGCKIKKHQKVNFYDKNGKRIKKKKNPKSSFYEVGNNYVVSKDPVLINGEKYRRIYGISMYGTDSYFHVFFVKNSDFKKFKPAKGNLGFAGTWKKSKKEKNYSNFKPDSKYVDRDCWPEFAKKDYYDPNKEDKEFIAGVNADYMGEDFDWDRVED